MKKCIVCFRTLPDEAFSRKYKTCDECRKLTPTEQHRLRYHNDTDYRANRIKQSSARTRRKMNTNAAFRESERLRKAEYYHKNTADPLFRAIYSAFQREHRARKRGKDTTELKAQLEELRNLWKSGVRWAEGPKQEQPKPKAETPPKPKPPKPKKPKKEAKPTPPPAPPTPLAVVRVIEKPKPVKRPPSRADRFVAAQHERRVCLNCSRYPCSPLCAEWAPSTAATCGKFTNKFTRL